MSLSTSSRRHFLFGSLLAGAIPSAGFRRVHPSLKALGYKSPNEKLNLAAIGAGGQPFSDLKDAWAGVENVVALADVDWKRGAPGFRQWPKAEKYKDFRQMLDRQGKRTSTPVVIGTPDHMHATCALACMQLGKHVYVEKPLTRTQWEARLLTQAAREIRRRHADGQSGIFARRDARGLWRLLWSGEIGDDQEVHAWHGGPGWPQGMQSIPAATDVPDTLDWNLWLGGAAARPYTAGDDAYRKFAAEAMGGREPTADFGFYMPFNWRGFFRFRLGSLRPIGACIFSGPANWGLQLSPASLLSVECIKKEGTSSFTYPLKNAVKYEFGPRGNMPPVTVYWSDSAKGDAWLPPGMTADEARKVPGTGPQVGPPPRLGPGGVNRSAAAPAGRATGYNCIFAGSKGYMGTSGRGEGVGLLPGSKWAEYKLPAAYLQRSPGASTGDNHSAHCRDWVRACKGGAPACSNFRLAGPYTEWLVLGAVATHYDGKLLWDAQKLEFTNNKDANKWIKPTFRKGWEIKL